MNNVDTQYVGLLKDIIENGESRADRTGTGTLAVFGRNLRYNLKESFPLVAIKETRYDKAFLEMLWFVRGEPNVNWLHSKNVHIWDDWADVNGNLGPVYGCQWRSWKKYQICYSGHEIRSLDSKSTTYYNSKVRVENIDQLQELIDGIKNNPTSRRHIISAWNVADLDDMGLPPCHWSMQFYVSLQKKTLSIMLNLRSNDMGLGNPFNIAQYALLLHMIAHLTDYEVGELIVNIGDAHIYNDHLEELKKMIETRKIQEDNTPQLIIKRKVESIDDFQIEDFEIVNYNPQPHIKLKISV